MRLRIEYLDHNERFAALLPREGRVVSMPRCVDSSLHWHLLRLDDPLCYDARAYSHLLLASRWQGQVIGGPTATSVFMLLVASPAVVADGFSCKRFAHAAWGMAHRLADAASGLHAETDP